VDTSALPVGGGTIVEDRYAPGKHLAVRRNLVSDLEPALRELDRLLSPIVWSTRPQNSRLRYVNTSLQSKFALT
jgi:hypothetical protein